MRSFISFIILKLSNILFRFSIFIGNDDDIDSSYLYKDQKNNIRIKYKNKKTEYEDFLADFLETETSIYKSTSQMSSILKQIPNLMVENVKYNISIDKHTNKYLVFNNQNLIAEYDSLIDLINEIDIIQNISEDSYNDLVIEVTKTLKNRKQYNEI
jgi:type II secretory pathway component HofQ